MLKKDPRVRLIRLYCKKRGIRGKITFKRYGENMTILFDPLKTVHIKLPPIDSGVTHISDLVANESQQERDVEIVSNPSTPTENVPDTACSEDHFLNGYIEDLKHGSLKIQECLRKDEEVRQTAADQIQKNVEETYKSTSELEKITGSGEGTGFSHLWRTTSSPLHMLLLPARMILWTFRSIISFLFFPTIFFLTLWVTLHIPKK